MAVNIHITIIELNALHTKSQNLFQELDAVIHLLMEAKHWGLRKSRNATSLNSSFKSLDTVRHPRRFKIVVIDIQITLKQMLRDFIGIRVNRAKKRGMVNITSSVKDRKRSGINTILHELNPLFTINVTMRDIKSKNVYSRVNSKATTQWRKTESANGVHLEGVASDNRSS